jgi:hypothetical protein
LGILDVPQAQAPKPADTDFAKFLAAQRAGVRHRARRFYWSFAGLGFARIPGMP